MFKCNFGDVSYKQLQNMMNFRVMTNDEIEDLSKFPVKQDIPSDRSNIPEFVPEEKFKSLFSEKKNADQIFNTYKAIYEDISRPITEEEKKYDLS